jgi:hypothetical protein
MIPLTKTRLHKDGIGIPQFRVYIGPNDKKIENIVDAHFTNKNLVITRVPPRKDVIIPISDVISSEYIGRKDSAGLPVYTGDIVEIWNGDKCVFGEIVSQDGSFHIAVDDELVNVSEIKVVGSIYSEYERVV